MPPATRIRIPEGLCACATYLTRTILGRSILKKCFFRRFAAATLMACSAPAWATDALILGDYTNKTVRVGERITVEGQCKAGALEGIKRIEWTIDGQSTAKKLDPVMDPKLQRSHIAYTVAPPANRTFQATLKCVSSSAFYSDDTSTRTITVLPFEPPAVTWDPANAAMTNGAITIRADVTDANTGIDKVWIKWGHPDFSSGNDQMTPAGGTKYSFTIDTTKLPEGSEGPKDVYINAKNENGYETGWKYAGSFRVDRTAPAIALDGSIPSHAKDSIRIDANATDGGTGVQSVWIRWKNSRGRWSSGNDQMQHGSGNNYSYSINAKTMPGGVAEVQLWARDKAGNDTGWQTKGRFTVDHDAPTVQLDSANPKYANNKIAIRANVSDALSGVASVWIQWGTSAKWSSGNDLMKHEGGNRYSFTIDAKAQPEGLKEIYIWARDNVGNDTGWLKKGDFSVIRSAPVLTPLSPPEDSLHNADLKIALSAADALIELDAAYGVHLCWMQKNAAGNWPVCGNEVKMTKNGDRYEYAIPLAGLQDGEIRVGFNARDILGNTNTGAWPKRRFVIDATPPLLEWREPQDRALLPDRRIRIAGSVGDAHPDHAVIEWRVEGDVAWQSHTVQADAGSGAFEYELTVPQADANYELRISAADRAGNLSAAAPIRTVIGQYPARDLFPQAQLEIAPDSPADKDDSGGFSKGDDLIYRLTVAAGAAEAHNLSAHYALPAGLARTPDSRPYLAPHSALADNAGLNAYWDGRGDAQLFASGVSLAADRTVIVDIPVTIIAQDATPLTSTLRLGASNARDELTLTHRLALQDRYPAARALTLQLASMQPDRIYRQGTAFDYRVTLQAGRWPLYGLALRYALPAGLQRNGAVRIDGESDAGAAALNPAWDGDGDARLLTPVQGAALAAGGSISLAVPVRVADAAAYGAALDSAIEAEAENLSGPVAAAHRIMLEQAAIAEDMLRLRKTVDQDTATPGATLRYTITFTNLGIEDLSGLVIRDRIQTDYLTLRSMQCGPSMPAGLQCCTVAQGSAQCAQAANSAAGALEWRIDGNLPPGASGSVGYEAQVNLQ
jgi:uncharacterized repeat protein (TIGR01451 family)